MCLYRHSVFVFGGTGYPFGESIASELNILDLKRLHWRRCELTNEPPPAVYGAVRFFLRVAAVIAIVPFHSRSQSMIIHDDHMYILCGTNRWSYNTNVFEIHLPTLRSTHIGHTFHEMEDFVDGGRHVFDGVG